MWHSNFCLHPRSPPILAVLTRMRNEYTRVQITAASAPHSLKETHFGELKRQERFNYHRNKQEHHHHHHHHEQQKQSEEQQRRQPWNAHKVTTIKQPNVVNNIHESNVTSSFSSSPSVSRVSHTPYGETNKSSSNSASLIIEDKIMQILSNDKSNLSQLSDTSMSSPNFYIEVCKLLLLGATFHASTTTPLIAQAISYVCQHIKHLTTVRQLMSACIPIINMEDGQTAGRKIVREHFLQPLINAVIESIPCECFDNPTRITSNTKSSSLESSILRDGENVSDINSKGDVKCQVNDLQHMCEEQQETKEQEYCERLHQEQEQMHFAIFSTFSFICKMLDAEDTPSHSADAYSALVTTENKYNQRNESEVEIELITFDAEYIINLAWLYEASSQHVIYLLKQKIAAENSGNKNHSTVSLSKAALASSAELDKYFFEKNELRVVIQAFLAIEKVAHSTRESSCSKELELSSPSFLQSTINNANSSTTIGNRYSGCREIDREQHNAEVAEVVNELYISFSEILTLLMEILRPSLTQRNRLRMSQLLHLVSLLSLVEQKEAVNNLLQLILELIRESVSHASKRDVIGIINTITNLITRTQRMSASSKHNAKSEAASADDNATSNTHLSLLPEANNNNNNNNNNNTITAVVNSDYLNSLLSALRPQFFLLTSHQNSRLQSFQCDMLINKFIRWNKVEGVHVPDDLLCLMLSQLGEQVHNATEKELLRYVRTLSKLYSASSNNSTMNINNTENRWEAISANDMEEKMNIEYTEHVRGHDIATNENNFSENETSTLQQRNNTNASKLHDTKNYTSNDYKSNDNIHKSKNTSSDDNYHNNVEEKASRTQQDAKYNAIESVINDCALRAMSLARENAISAQNAARLIILLHHLSYHNLDQVFNSVLSIFERSIQANVYEQSDNNSNKKYNSSTHDNNYDRLGNAIYLKNKTSTENLITTVEDSETQVKDGSDSPHINGKSSTETDKGNAEISKSKNIIDGDVKNEATRKENERNDSENEDEDEDEGEVAGGEDGEEEEVESEEEEEDDSADEIVIKVDAHEENANESNNNPLSCLVLLDAINLVMNSWDVNVFSSNYYHERVSRLRHNVMDKVESSLLQANSADELINFYNKVRHSQKLLTNNRVSANPSNTNNSYNNEYTKTNGWNYSYNAMHSSNQEKQMNVRNENNIGRREGNKENVDRLEENANDCKGDEADENGLKPEEAGLGAFTMETFARRVEMMVPRCNAHQLCKLAFDVAACCQNGSVGVNRTHSVLERVFRHIETNMQSGSVDGHNTMCRSSSYHDKESANDNSVLHSITNKHQHLQQERSEEQRENAFVLTATDAKFLIDAVRFSSSYHLSIPSVVYTTINNELTKICEMFYLEETTVLNGNELVESKLIRIEQVQNIVKTLTSYFKNLASIVSNKDKGNKETTLDSINDDDDDDENDESESENNNSNSKSCNKNSSKNDNEDNRGRCSKQVTENTRDNWHRIFSDDVRSAVCALEMSLFKLLPILLESRIDLPPALFVSETVVLVERATSLENVTNNLMQTKSITINYNHVKEREQRQQTLELQELQEFENEEHREDAEEGEEQENETIRDGSVYDAGKLQQEELEQELEYEEEELEEEEEEEEFETDSDNNQRALPVSSTRQVLLITAFSTHSLQIRLSLQEALFSVADLVSAVMFELRTRLNENKSRNTHKSEKYEERELLGQESNPTKNSSNHVKMQQMNEIVAKTGSNFFLLERKQSNNINENTRETGGEFSSSDVDHYNNNKKKNVMNSNDNVTFQVDDLLTLLHCYVYAEVRHSELLKEIMTEIQLSTSTMTLINLTEFFVYIMRNGITYSSSSESLRRAVEAKIGNASIEECCHALHKIHLYEKSKITSPDNTPIPVTENRIGDDAEATLPNVSTITTSTLVEMLIDRLNSFVSTEAKWMALANTGYALSEMMLVVNTISSFSAQARHVHDAYYTIAVRACVVEMQDLLNAVSEHTIRKREGKLTKCTSSNHKRQFEENTRMPHVNYELAPIEEYCLIYLTRLLDSTFRLFFRILYIRNKDHARVSAFTLHKLVLMAADILEIYNSTYATLRWKSLWSLTSNRMLEIVFKIHAHFTILYNVNFLQPIFDKKYALPWMLTSAVARNNRHLVMETRIANWTSIVKHISTSLLLYERGQMEESCKWMQLVQNWCTLAVQYFTIVCKPYIIPQSLPNTHLTTTAMTELLNGLIVVYEMLHNVNATVCYDCLNTLRQLINCTSYRSKGSYAKYNNNNNNNNNNKNHHHSPFVNVVDNSTSSDNGGGGGSGNKKELEKLSVTILHSCLLLLQAHQSETIVLSNEEQQHCFQLIESIMEEICTRKNLLFGDKMELLLATLTNYMSSSKATTEARETSVSNDLQHKIEEKVQENVAPAHLSLRKMQTTEHANNEEKASHEDNCDSANDKILLDERLELLLTKLRTFIAKEMMMSLTKDNTNIDVGELFTRRLLLSLNCCLVRYVVRSSMYNEQNDDDKDNSSTITIPKNAMLTNNVQSSSNLTDVSKCNNSVDSVNLCVRSNNNNNGSNTKSNIVFDIAEDIDDDDDDYDVVSVVDEFSKAKSKEEAMHACVDVLVNALLALMRYKRASMQQRGAVCESSVHTRVARKILDSCDDELKNAGQGKNETVAQICQLCKMLSAV